MEKDFKWHKVSEEEKEEIRQKSKNLLNEFASKIEKIKTKESHFENKEGFREEGSGWNTDPNFRDLMFLNAPFVEDDFIVAEKGGWK
ncbi:MAG: hypothetical protein WC494_00260 [Candidatus Pacearchaeota archaeon]